MNLKNIKLDFAATTGGTTPVFLAGVAEDLEYGTDNRPSGKKLGTVYTVACPADGFNLLKVRTPEQEPPISADELAARNASGRFVYALSLIHI